MYRSTIYPYTSRILSPIAYVGADIRMGNEMLKIGVFEGCGFHIARH